MSVNYNTTLRSSRLQLVGNAIDAGGANGVLRLLDGTGNTLSTLSLARPAGTVASAILSFSGLSWVDPAAAASGSATAARIEDSTGTVVISGLTVGTVGTDIVLAPTNAIVAGQTVAIQQATITGN